jgi:hypothetical protein
MFEILTDLGQSVEVFFLMQCGDRNACYRRVRGRWICKVGGHNAIIKQMAKQCRIFGAENRIIWHRIKQVQIRDLAAKMADILDQGRMHLPVNLLFE